jgi:hypothetical protein
MQGELFDQPTSPDLAWQRKPRGNTGYADYLLTRDGETIAAVRWCGHPTALRKYYVAGIPLLDGQTFASSKDAKTAVETIIGSPT